MDDIDGCCGCRREEAEPEKTAFQAEVNQGVKGMPDEEEAQGGCGRGGEDASRED